MTTRFAQHLLQGDHASLPLPADVPEGTLFSCSDHELVYQSDTVAWTTWATFGTSGTAPDSVDYLVGTATGALGGEIVAGTAPGGELGGTWAAPTVDATHSGSTHAAAQSAAEATAAAALTAHGAAADPHTAYQKESEKGAASGYASLDAGTLVPAAQLATGTPDGSKFLRDDRTWAAGGGGGGASALDDLTDVNTTGKTTGDALVWDGSSWGADAVAGGGGGGGTPMAMARASRTAGNYTVNSTSWANLDTGLDLVIAAEAGDVLLVSVSMLWSSLGIAGALDAATIVGGSPVNYVSGGGGAADYGVQAWYGGPDNYGGGGAIQYVVQAGDISGGNVTLRLRARLGAAGSRLIYGVTADPFHWSVVNLSSGGGGGGGTGNAIMYSQASDPGTPADTEALWYDTDAVAAPGGGGSFDPDIHMPWHVDLQPVLSPPDATVGTWSRLNGNDATGPYASGYAVYMFNLATGALNDAVAWDIVLAAGTWDCTIYCRRSTNAGIITLQQDGVDVGAFDPYGAIGETGGTIAGIAVATTGKHRMNFKMASKNASSTGYFCGLLAVHFRRTA